MKLPSHVAFIFANIEAQRFNDAVARGFYPCAPATEGARRKFSEFDLVGLHIFARLVNMGLSQKDAGRFACMMLNQVRSNHNEGMLSAHVVLTKEHERWVMPYYGDDARGRASFNPRGNFITAINVNTRYVVRLAAQQIILYRRLVDLGMEDLRAAMIVNEWKQLEAYEQRPTKLGYSKATDQYKIVDEDIARIAGPLEWATFLQIPGGGWVGEPMRPVVLPQDAHIIDLSEVVTEAETYELSDE